MHMLYNSDNFVVVRFDVAADDATPADGQQPPARGGGYEIVDKFARKEIFIEGDLAETFKQGVQALVDLTPASAGDGQAKAPASAEAIQQATQEALDEYIGRFTILAQQPVVLH